MVRTLLVMTILVATMCALVVLQGSPAPLHRAVRRASAKRAFRRAHPCPATGQVKGACPGYIIDHVKPLACGGADAPSNMQWQTVAEGKAKDAVERKNCGSGI